MAAAAVRVPLAAPPCPDCRGGGDVNGVQCRSCEGRGRAGARKRVRAWRAKGGRLAHAVAAPAGVLAASLPGLGGAAGVSVGLGGITGHLAGHGLTPWVTVAVAGVFGLMIDRRT